MPNTLVHIGIQGTVNRVLVSSTDLKWVFLGCVIPDVPWILQRFVQATAIPLDPLSLRQYVIAQASLAVSLLLCGAFAYLSARPRAVFALLAVNSLLHLLLDACETKWANGVHLFAPISWDLINFGWFWPESWPVYAGTILGMMVAVLTLRQPVAASLPLRSRSGVLPAAALFLTYLLVPLTLMDGPAVADNHSIATLADRQHRPGRLVAFDRNRVVSNDGRSRLHAWTGEELKLAGPDELAAGIVSVQGRFRDVDTIDVVAVHYHKGWLRNSASFVGLALVATIWVVSLFVKGKRGNDL